MSRIVISLGQIPAKLDAVKYIGNRFQGGLMLKLAHRLAQLGHHIEIVKWKHNKIDTSGVVASQCVHNVDDIDEYSQYMEKNAFDVYVLGAAVANLQPVNPWEGKFPSHNYKEGEEFDIKFKIAPRIINTIKKNHPNSTLIGFKLSTGNHFDAFETLKESNADLIIYNNPKDLNEVTFCYKTFLTSVGTREDIAGKIDYLCEIKYHKTDIKGINTDTSYNLQTFHQIKELEKYVLDEDNHGSIGVVFNNKLYTHTRHHKYIGIVEDNRHIDDDMTVCINTNIKEKFTEALTVFTWLRGKFPKHKYFIHTHKDMNIPRNLEVGYIPPNSNMDTISRIISIGHPLDTVKTEFIIKSDCHGFFMSFEKLENVFDLLSDRNWKNYDPPTRYVNDNSNIFNDILEGKIKRDNWNRILEIGGNTDSFPKVCNLVSNSGRLRLDPYFEQEIKYQINYDCGELYDLVVAKNCAPIMGIDALHRYSKIAERMLFNFPKQYVCDREVECVSGAIKRELSHVHNGIVFHSLLNIKGESSEADMIHTYDALTEKRLYDKFHKDFELQFRYTDRGIWCLMERKK